MSFPKLIILDHLLMLGQRWRRQRGTLWTAVFLGGLALFSFGLGFAIWRGWITDAVLAKRLTLTLVVGAGLGAIGIRVALVRRKLEGRFLAQASEDWNPPLLDRLNTLIHLEAQPANAPGRVFLEPIQSQAASVLKATISKPFPARTALGWLLLSVTLLGGSAWFNLHYKPWTRLKHVSAIPLGSAATPDTTFELAPESVRQAEKHVSKGEVRITDPGRDLKLTKVDVVELRIEAAANETLESVNWAHSINGQPPVQKALGAPKESNYAAYTEHFYLDELTLGDWDVVSYYAEAAVAKVGRLTSEIYFIEIRPFRSEIAKMPGGEKGKAGQALREISALIDRQQQVLRETRRFLGREEPDAKRKEQDREKLRGAEAELKNSTDALYAKIATTLENQPMAVVLDGLARGAESMERATVALREDVVTEAQQKELAALQELVATRKNIQKVINESPDTFDKNDEQSRGEPLEALAGVTELRKRTQNGREEVRRLESEQRTLRKEAAAAWNASRDPSGPKAKELKDRLASLPEEDPEVLEHQKEKDQRREDWKTASEGLARKQTELKERLAGLRASQPELFRGAQEEANAASDAMEQAATGLTKNDKMMYAQNRAVDRLQDLQKAVAAHDPTRAMEDAFRLKQLVEKQAAGMQQAAQGQMSPESARQMASAALKTTQQLKELTGPGQVGLGPELGEALSGAKQSELEGDLQRAAEGKDGKASAQQAAGRAAEGLNRILAAFQRSLPQAASKGEAGAEGSPDDALGRAMAMIQSLLRRKQDGRPAGAQDQASQQEEALGALKLGLSKSSQWDAAGRALLLQQAERALASQSAPVDPAEMTQLLDSIERFRVELSEKRLREELKEEMKHTDPAKISPLYRDRVQQYFRHLSEQ